MTVGSVTDQQGKKMLDESLLKWIKLHSGEIRKWLDEHVNIEDRKNFIDYHLSKKSLRYAMCKIIMQEKMSNNDKLKKILEPLVNDRGKIWLITGSKGSGKTSLAYFIAELLHEKYNETIWWFGPPAKTPDFVENSTMIKSKLPPNCTAILDEASIQYFSRGNQGNSNLIQQLPTIRHMGTNFIVITQSTSLTDLNFVRLCDAILFKSYSVFQNDTERFKVSDELMMFMPAEKNEVLYFDNESIFTFHYPLPDWWSSAYSKPYSPITTDAQKYRFILKLLPELDIQNIQAQCELRNITISAIDIITIKLLSDFYGYDYLMKQKNIAKLINEGFDDTPVNLQVKGITKKLKGKFGFTPLEMEEVEKSKERSPQLAIAEKRNLNMVFVNDIQTRAIQGKNIILSVYGATGTGKSWAALAVAEAINHIYGKKFPTSNVVFEMNEIPELLQKLKEQNTIIRDEQAREFGAGSGRAEQELQNIEETIRKKQINLIYCAPEVRTHIHHYILRTWGIDRKLNIARMLVFTPKGIPLGYITTGKPDKTLVASYEKRKDSFLKKITEQKVGSDEYLKKIAEKVTEHELWDKAKTQSERLTVIAMAAPNLTEDEKRRVRDLAKLLF